MNEFVLLFRWSKEQKPSEEKMPEAIREMQEWMGAIQAQGQLISYGHALSDEGRVVKADGVVTDGPYTEIKETLGGYITIAAADFEEAVAIAKNCPIVLGGGNVEVRKAILPEENI